MEGGNTGSEQWPAATTNLITYILLEGKKTGSEQWAAATNDLLPVGGEKNWRGRGETLGQSNGLLQQPI
ncbi:hypothetical protein K435DRAFT_855520 [Dendrothele bispora CBS 962.96]|uniref:Uncharacterized protein n=1 Tax=Dendrothele bispora (strain CBS 962.96) TaxID=1314807 RepID=A0A4S8MB05_DENBC|nr:hypothetical protein K435DRAFT_855520 [Dendrothele bispora CBS 962.96]